jgi:hypothetical protein
MKSSTPFLFVLLLLAAAIAGCGAKTGNGLWDLRVGRDARVVSADGSDLILESVVAPSPKQRGRRDPGTVKVETITVAPGTRVVVLAIDGNDARVEIKDGPRAGSIHWVECARLEPLVQ